MFPFGERERERERERNVCSSFARRSLVVRSSFARRSLARSSLTPLTPQIYNETYYKLVGKGGALDRNLGKVRSLAQTNFSTATESLHSLNVRFNTAKERAKARFIAYRATALRRKLTAYQALLGNMRKYSNAVTPDQMAHVMSEITRVHHQMTDLEAR